MQRKIIDNNDNTAITMLSPTVITNIFINTKILQTAITIITKNMEISQAKFSLILFRE